MNVSIEYDDWMANLALLTTINKATYLKVDGATRRLSIAWYHITSSEVPEILQAVEDTFREAIKNRHAPAVNKRCEAAYNKMITLEGGVYFNRETTSRFAAVVNEVKKADGIPLVVQSSFFGGGKTKNSRLVTVYKKLEAPKNTLKEVEENESSPESIKAICHEISECIPKAPTISLDELNEMKKGLKTVETKFHQVKKDFTSVLSEAQFAPSVKDLSDAIGLLKKTETSAPKDFENPFREGIQKSKLELKKTGNLEKLIKKDKEGRPLTCENRPRIEEPLFELTTTQNAVYQTVKEVPPPLDYCERIEQVIKGLFASFIEFERKLDEVGGLSDSSDEEVYEMDDIDIVI